MTFQYTAVYASLAALMFLGLSYRVVQFRRRFSIGLGCGGEEQLECAQRAHGNFVEYVPLTLILLGLTEAQGFPSWWINLAGTTLIVARLLHAWGLSHSSGRSFGRFWGTLVTWLLLLVLAALNLYGAAVS